MRKFRKGDLVGRISYGKDVIFEIKQIIKTSEDKQFAILKGVTQRIVADSVLEDLELMDKRTVNNEIEKQDTQILKRIETCLKKPQFLEIANNKNKRSRRISSTGKILHLDGDKRYSDKSLRYYQSLGLNAVVKNIPENKQPTVMKNLIVKYQPDIVIITRTRWNDKKRNRF